MKFWHIDCIDQHKAEMTWLVVSETRQIFTFFHLRVVKHYQLDHKLCCIPLISPSDLPEHHQEH